MYTPARFNGGRSPQQLLGPGGFGLLVTAGDAGPWTTHLPYVVEDGGARVLLHMARANPHWRGIESEPRCRLIVQGPHGYVSPNWYDTTQAVPTWNYEAVHLDGTARLCFDEAGLLQILRATIACFEDGVGQASWSLDRVAQDFLEPRLRSIVGITLHVERAQAKQKLSQDRSPAERARVMHELRRRGNEALACAMAAVSPGGVDP